MSNISAKIADAAVIASGWQYDLAEIEFHALASEDKTAKTIHQRVTICTKQTAEKIAHCSSLVTETLHPVGHNNFSTQNKHVEQIVEWCQNNLQNEGKTIAVRAEKIGIKLAGWSSRGIEQSVGGALYRAGWKIDLTSPQITLRILALNHNDSRTTVESENNPLIVWGLKSSGTSLWDGRTAPKRPFFKPISLDPRLARAMVNLACPNGGNILDPFCGTGGILLEAASIGLHAFGSDADSRMVWGSRENLEWLATQTDSSETIGSAETRRGSAIVLSGLWGDTAPFSGFAFDPPYGRNSWKSDDGWQLFVDALASCASVATDDAGLTALLPWPPAASEVDLQNDATNPVCVTFGKQWVEVVEEIRGAGWEIESTISIPVHRSLARLLLICKKSALN
ncbi:MAG: hypothetical protein HOE69_07420 [Euryarchaeota archaeon]|jgi:tRNA (guanine10-N2)-dimethyltransferase|nr:hypothetical protein [Euryarchaeota archaeon]